MPEEKRYEDMSSKERNVVYLNNVIKRYWFIVDDDIIGGHAIANTDKPISELSQGKKEFQVANFLSFDIAKHMVGLHNSWVANTASSINSVLW